MSPGTSASGGTRGGPGRDRHPDPPARVFQPTPNIHGDAGPTVKEALATGQKKKEMRDLLARQQAEKDYTRQGVMKLGPQLGRTGGRKNFLGNWASSIAGSQLGGGLGSMLFGPWGMLLGSIFGQGAGRRGWKASQTPEKETMKQILLPKWAQNLGLFNKRINEQPRGEGIETIDIKDKYLRNQPQRSAKDYIDLSKSYSETDIIPSKYAGADLAKFAGSEYDVKTSLEETPELHQEMNDAATKAQNDYLGKIQSGEIPFPDNLQFEMDKIGNDARHNIMQSQSDAPDIFSETLQEGVDRSNVQGKQKRSREQELLKEMGI